eukprot:Clim_evm13s57 gene=Clim_evmTU13s57
MGQGGDGGTVTVAVAGCTHGEFDVVFNAVQDLKNNGTEIDLLILTGDVQTCRDQYDLDSMAVPHKYKKLGGFVDYYNGTKTIPVPTICIGGNHEASAYFSELPYGGWLCPNLWYMGLSNVVSFAGLRIKGVSGIYKSHDWDRRPRVTAPMPPGSKDVAWNEGQKRGIYHQHVEDQLHTYAFLDEKGFSVASVPEELCEIDVMVTHDWPTVATNRSPSELLVSDTEHLIRRKSFFADEIRRAELGSPKHSEYITMGKETSRYWFSSHLHVKYTALMGRTIPQSSCEQEQSDDGGTEKWCRFLALDKVEPHREWLQVVPIQRKPRVQPFGTHSPFESDPVLRFCPEHLLQLYGKEKEATTPVKDLLGSLNAQDLVPPPFNRNAVAYTRQVAEQLRLKDPWGL